MDAQKGGGNRSAMKAIFDAGHVPGVVGYHAGAAVGWVQIDERAAFPRLASSRVPKPVDDRPVWSAACFLVARGFRRKGVSAALLRGACDFARERGAGTVEGYPIDTPKRSYPAVYAWTGFVSAFRDAGFVEVARRSETRPIMRKRLT